jgi:hypothetical protein
MPDTERAIHNTKAIIGKLMAGEVSREIATAAFSGVHAFARLVELQRRLIEQDALIERIEIIESRQRKQGRGTASWQKRQGS